MARLKTHLTWLIGISLAGSLACAQSSATNPGMANPGPGQGQEQNPSSPPQQPEAPGTGAGAQGQSGTQPQAGTQGEPGTSGNNQADNDKSFVKKALQGGNAEVQLGQLAQRNGQSEDVKHFGAKMVTDHSALDNKLTPAASQLGVSPGGTSHKDKQLISKLENLSGPQFDNEYMKAMVKDHQHDLKDFQKEAQTTQNPQLKQDAQEGATVISQHLQLAEQIAKKHNASASGSANAQTTTASQ